MLENLSINGGGLQRIEFKAYSISYAAQGSNMTLYQPASAKVLYTIFELKKKKKTKNWRAG